MQMKKLIINGQTFIIVDAEAMRKLADSDLNMKGKLIYDAIIHANKLSFPGLNQDELVEVVSGSVEQGVPMLVFSGHDEGSMPVLRNIHDGIEDNDVATVGQVKAVDLTEPKKLNHEQQDAVRKNIGAIGDDDEVQRLRISGSFAAADDGVHFDFSGSQLHNVGEPLDDADATNKGYVDGLVGDIETALDSILAIQESLIGGGTV